MRYGGIEEAIDQGIKADIVILSHVLEHFTDPTNELKAVRRLLKSDGMVYVEVPGILNVHVHRWDCDFMWFIVLAHTYLFSKSPLEYLIRKCGYQVQYSDEFIHMLCRPSATELDDIGIAAQHAGLVIQYLQDCERKRIPRYLVKRCLLFVRHVGGATLRILGVYPLARRLYHKILSIPRKYLT